MKYLPAPYGWSLLFPGIGISIRVREGAEVYPEYVAGLTAGYGCPPFILPKIEACIRHSGRYDCFVMSGLERQLPNLCNSLRMLGCDLYVRDKLYELVF